MPLFEYKCPGCGKVTERLCKYEHRDILNPCRDCRTDMPRILSAHHQAPDGIYSYAPNEGSPDKFERWDVQMKAEKEAKREKEGR